MPRDTLVEMFWGDQDESRARHSLSNALSSLRRPLGTKAISTRDADVALASDAPLVVDALELAEAVEGREFGRAAGLYLGPFLDGVYLETSAAFEHWLSRERRRLEALFVQACTNECTTLTRAGRWPECHALARRWLDAEPLSANAALHLLTSAKAPGTRSALANALEEYETLKTHLANEFELAPEPSVRALAESIREQLTTVAPEPTKPEPRSAATPPADQRPRVDPTVVAAASSQPEPRSPRQRLPELMASTAELRAMPKGRGLSRLLRNHRVLWSVVGVVTAVSVAALYVATRAVARSEGGSAAEPPPRKPTIAMLGMALQSDDSTLAWLSDGLPQMIAGKLAHNAGIDVVPPSQVHAVLARSGNASRPLQDATARDLARRVGATLEARGTIVRGTGNLVLDLTVHDVRTGALVRSAVVTRRDALALADEAAARILAAANVGGPGPQVGELETSSLEAYQHYMRALDDAAAGREAQEVHELDEAIALDSGFVAALRARTTMAINVSDTALTRRLRAVTKAHADRATEFDRLDSEAEDAFLSGERERSEALARTLLRRYPRDPRAYQRLESTLSMHGEVAEAERVATQALALDSLAMAAGDGPCAPCRAYFNIIALHWTRSDLRGAADWARRWIRIQPDGAAGWQALAWTYAYMQQPDSALAFIQRAISLSGGNLWANGELSRMLIVTRRYASADSAIRAMESVPSDRETAADLRSELLREHGQFRESTRILTHLVSVSPGSFGFANLIIASDLRELGDYAAAARRYEAAAHPVSSPATLPLPASQARGFCWMHVLAGDALAPSGDSVALQATADTLEAGCARSFYGRDWRLFHHVRGAIAARAHRYAEAEREFKQALWTPVEGWSRTTVELADVQAAQGRPLDAVATLRTAYATRLDAMGRYVPISEIDYHMARAFNQANQSDSARVYAALVRAAWANADPEIRRRLDGLP